MDERKEDQKETRPIYIKTVDLGPHGEKVAVLDDSAYNAHSPKRALIWGAATFLVGASSVYFVIGLHNNLENTFTKMITPAEAKPTMTPVAEAPLQKQGSNDPTASSYGLATTTDNYYFLKENYQLPKTSALAYAVMDLDTGEDIIHKNSDAVYPPASVTKLLTTTVAKEHMDIHQELVVTNQALSVYGSENVLYAGQHILLTDILYPLLMESSNNAAEVIAENYKDGKDAFVKLMNQTAKSIGMTNSVFIEPSGVSHENVTTANDLLKLASYIYKNHYDILDITRVQQFTIGGHTWQNGNRLMQDKVFLGGKNGFTDAAGETTVSFFRIPVGKTYHNVVVVILQSKDRKADADVLLHYIENNVGFTNTNNPDQ